MKKYLYSFILILTFTQVGAQTVDNIFAITVAKDAPIPGDVLSERQYKNLKINAIVCENISTADDLAGIGSFNATDVMISPEDWIGSDLGNPMTVYMSPKKLGEVIYQNLNPGPNEQIVLALLIEGRYKMFILTPSVWEESVGIEEKPFVPKVNLYPNPANDWIIMEGDFKAGEVLSIVDLQSKQVLNTTWQEGSKIDISDLSTGMYVIKTTLGPCILTVEK